MELTKGEIEIADRWISKRERQLAQWPYRRWIILVVFSTFTLFGYRTLKDGMRTIDEDKAIDLQVSLAIGGPPPPDQEQRWVVGSMMKIAKVLEARYQVVTYALLQVGLGYLEILFGVALLCLNYLRWNTGERDALICKLLRSKLTEFQTNDRTDTPATPS